MNPSDKPEVCILSIHPAPYRDPVLNILAKRGELHLEVFTMFDTDSGHAFWDLSAPEYRNSLLGRNITGSQQHALHLRLLPLLWTRAFDAVVVPGMNHFTSVLAIVNCIVRSIPYIIVTDKTADSPSNPVIHSVKERLLRKASAVWVPGEASRKYHESLGLDPEVIFEGAYTIDENETGKAVEMARLRKDEFMRRIGIPENSRVALMVANMLPNRAYPFLIDVFATIEKANDKAYLIIVGDGPEKPIIDSIIRERGIRNVRIFRNVPFEELSHFYAIADVYVHTGQEPYSTAISYAAASGVPVVSSASVGAAVDFVIHETTGFLVNDDRSCWTDSIAKIISNEMLRFQMGNEIRKIAGQRSMMWAAKEFEKAIILSLRRGPTSRRHQETLENHPSQV